MEYLADWLRRRLPNTSVDFIPARDPFTYLTPANLARTKRQTGRRIRNDWAPAVSRFITFVSCPAEPIGEREFLSDVARIEDKQIV
jgi:hypothetical protein